MENRITEITSKENKAVKIGIIPGHFATNHSHVNYYVDLTGIKTSHAMAIEAASVLAQSYLSGLSVDTIICLEGTEMLGAFFAQKLADAGINSNKDIAVLTPELNSNNQMIFRDNIQSKVWGKNVVLLISSASTGKTISRSVECLQYYSGKLVGISAIFSAIDDFNGMPVNAIFRSSDLPKYETFLSHECPMCKQGKKIDAVVNSYGYMKL